MNEITKELLDALRDAEEALSHVENNLHVRVNPPTLGRMREAIAKAEAALAAPQPSSDAVEAAFREGFRSPTTYNDTVMNSEDDAWGNSEARAEAAKAAPQPADDGWIPWEGGDCPVETKGHDLFLRFRDGSEHSDYVTRARGYDWEGERRGHPADIIAYRVVKS